MRDNAHWSEAAAAQGGPCVQTCPLPAGGASPIWAAGFPGLQPECSGKGQKSCAWSRVLAAQTKPCSRTDSDSGGGGGRAALAGSQGPAPGTCLTAGTPPTGALRGKQAVASNSTLLGRCFASRNAAGFPGRGPPRPAASRPSSRTLPPRPAASGPSSRTLPASPGDRPLGDPGLLSWTPTGTGRGRPRDKTVLRAELHHTGGCASAKVPPAGTWLPGAFPTRCSTHPARRLHPRPHSQRTDCSFWF